MFAIARGSLRFPAVSILLFLSFVSQVAGQSSRGTVTGLISDPSKAAVSTATVDLTNQDTKVTRSTNTNSVGIYRFDAVDPGNYTLKVSAPGFKALNIAAFPVAAAQVSVDGQLEVGSVSSTVEVSSESALVQTEAPVHGGTITATTATDLPITNQNPVSLVLTLPGVSSNRYSFGVGTFPVNGARARSNNFLIDGTENNDISVTGQAFQITNPDAVQEVSAQTSNFDSEYGRAGGGVFNVITKSGSNEFHGTARYYLESTFLDALTNLEKLDPVQLQRGHPSPGTDQFFAGTLGGPVVKNKTFFFSAYQEERQVSTSTIQLFSLSGAGRAALLAAFPNNPRVALLNQITAGADATAQLFNVSSGTGPAIQFGTYTRSYPNTFRDRQLLERIDHSFSNNDQLSIRYLYDNNTSPTGGSVGFLGFDTAVTNEVNSGLLTETHTFSPVSTNEFRLGYNRIYYFFPFDATSPLASQIPTTTINSIGSGSITLGVPSNLPQGRIANNYELQDTVSRVWGKHSVRVGTSLLDQRAKQAAPFNIRGTLSYQASSGQTGLSNYIADFGGSSGTAAHDFGSPTYYPKLFRQAYFAEDRWRASEALTISLGLRYEYFGEPINSLRTPAYTGLFNINPMNFTGPYSQPDSVKPDRNNFGPSVGIAYAPGDKKTVFRTGFSMGYDSFFNNIASNAVASAPNNVSTTITSSTSAAQPRGTPNFSQSLPTIAVFSPLSSQTLVVGNLLNPYYLHYSAGVQRELPAKFVLEVSYVGTRGVKLFATEDLNPLVPVSLEHFPAGYSPANLILNTTYQNRWDPLQGARNIRTNGGSSSYNSAQVTLNRRYAQNLLFTLSYTRSKYIDNGTDIFSVGGNNQTQSTAVPSIFGGLTSDRSVSAYDRPNRMVLTGVYEIPFMRSQQNWLGHVVGGWLLSGIYTIESGAPINILNGVDADGIGGNLDRPNLNLSGIPGTRAVPSATSPTGYINPDANNAPIDPATAEYVGLPSCTSTVPCSTGTLGRNTFRTPILNNFDADLGKTIQITERTHLEFRAEVYNLFNHRQYGTEASSPFDSGTTTIGANVTNTTAGRFLQPGFADGGARVLKFQAKFVF